MSKFDNFCPVCGGELENGTCPSCDSHKRMCLNCEFCKEGEDEELYCRNADNLEDAVEKAKAALSEIKGFKLAGDLKMEPIALKKPTVKCSRWLLSDAIKKRFEESFT